MATAFDYQGKWANQLGSKMTIKVEAGGLVSGSFVSPVQPDRPEPLVGFVRNNVIVFCNAFDVGSGTMLGQPLMNGETDRFQTWWHYTAIKDAEKPWSSVRTGCDTFVRVH